ncbi:MAG: ABC transporter permease subunit [Bacteroidia bacterium]
MKNIWIIANREFRTFLDSLVAYILLVVFLGLSGLFTWLFGTDVFYIKQATMQPFFQIAYWTLFFFIPALTMRMIAEEKRVGTMESLLTRAITDWQIVAGKYLACMLLIAIALLFTIPYYLTIAWLGPIDHGAVWCGYLGLLLLSSAYISIGIFTSSITSNQIVAFLLALVIGVFFHWIFGLVSSVASGSLASLLNYLSTSTHFASVSRGVIDSRDVIYFVSISALGLILAEIQLAGRNVVD